MLKVFVAKGCAGCRKAVELADWARLITPNLTVEVIDITAEQHAGDGRVFAVPVFMYNSKPVFWGNPSQQELRAWLTKLPLEA